MLKEAVFLPQENINIDKKDFIAKSLSWLTPKLNAISFLAILSASVIVINAIKLKSKAGEKESKYKKVINVCISVIIGFFMCSVLGLFLDFIASNFSQFFFQEGLLSSISKSVGILLITYILSFSTFFLWKIPKVFFIFLAVFIIVYLLFLLADIFKSISTASVLFLVIASVVSIMFGSDFDVAKEKVSQIINDFVATVKYMAEIRNHMQTAAFKSSFTFFIPVIAIFSKLGKTNVNAVTLWMYFIIIQISYQIYVNYNVRMIVYFNSNEVKHIISTFYDVAHTTIYHEIVSIYNLLVDFMEYLGANQTFGLERIESHEYDALIDFIGRCPDAVNEVTKIQDHIFLKWIKVTKVFILVPLHLSIYMIRYCPNYFDSLCRFSIAGPLSVPFTLIRNLSLFSSFESYMIFVSYAILTLFFIVLEYSFICSMLSVCNDSTSTIHNSIAAKILENIGGKSCSHIVDILSPSPISQNGALKHTFATKRSQSR